MYHKNKKQYSVIINNNLFLMILLIVISLSIRLPFLLDNIRFNNDSPVYSRNIEYSFFSGKYDVQLPGYISYIYLGRLINYFVNNSVSVQHIINLILVCLISVSLFLLLILLKVNKIHAFLFSIIFSFLNVMLLGSLVGGNRLFLALASILLIYFSLKIKDNKYFILLFSIIFAFFMGFRQDLSFMFMPLYFYLFYKVKNIRTILLSLLLFIITCSIWFIPLVIEYGGLSRYISMLRYQFDSVSQTSILLSGPKIIPFLNIFLVILFSVNAFLFIIPLFFYSIIKKEYKIDKNIFLILLFSFMPAFLFNFFVHNGNFVLILAFAIPLFIFLIMNFKISSKMGFIVVIIILLLQLSQFFGLRMIKRPNFLQKFLNASILQYSFDGVKTGRVITFRKVNDN